MHTRFKDDQNQLERINKVFITYVAFELTYIVIIGLQCVRPGLGS